MTQIRGRCTEIRRQDLVTGVTAFKILDYESEQEISVLGMGVELKENQQYFLEGNWNQDGCLWLEKIRRFSDSAKESVHILSTCISGISESLAEEIVDTLGEDIFSYGEQRNLRERLLAFPGIGEKKAQEIWQLVGEGTSKNELFCFLSDYNVPYPSINRCMKHGKIHVQDICEDPYQLLAYDVSFDICESIAVTNHVEPWNVKRIQALIHMVMEQMRSRGDTRMEYGKMIKAISGYSFRNGKSTVRIPPILIDIVLHSSDSVKIYLEGETQYVAPLDLFLQERDIVRSVFRLITSKRGTVYNLRQFMEQIEEKEQISFNKEQKEAFEILEEGGIGILLGGPGTGKTTTINGIVKAYLSANPDQTVLLCAPTGRAAVRMREVSGQPAQTIHKAMNLKWFQGMWDDPEPFPYELIVADEMSMCDTKLFSLFLRAAESGTTVLIAGDYHQIPSIGPGQILRDLAESGYCKVYQLTQMLRQKEGSLIARNAKAILTGDHLCYNDEFQISIAQNDLEIMEGLRCTETEGIPQILCPIKGSIAGTEAINLLIQEEMNWMDQGIVIDGLQYHVGDNIIMGENNYEKGYMNGELGEILDIQNGELKFRFTDRDQELQASEIHKMGLSNALTFHRSQGAECDEVLIILPSEAEPMASRELLYTAVTRARKKVRICAVGRVWKAFLEAEGKSLRECGLKSGLQGRIRY